MWKTETKKISECDLHVLSILECIDRCSTFRQRLHFLPLCTCMWCPLMPQPHYHSTFTSFNGQIGLNWVALHKNGRYWDECQEWQMWFKISFAAFLSQLMHFLWMSLASLSPSLTVASPNPRLWHRCERFSPPSPQYRPTWKLCRSRDRWTFVGAVPLPALL